MQHPESYSSSSSGLFKPDVNVFQKVASSFSESEAVSALETLEKLVSDPLALHGIAQDIKVRLLCAAGKLSRPLKGERRQCAKAMKQHSLAVKRQRDKVKLDKTTIRKWRKRVTYPSAHIAETEALTKNSDHEENVLEVSRKCYICKKPYNTLHFFYDQLCPPCAENNYTKREQSADVSGRIAMVTGGRIKIGYQTALKLLRSGARVIVTSRFPKDAAKRYAMEHDFLVWKDRLEIFGLDMRFIPQVEKFAHFLNQHLPTLDFLIHNACQTVRRPPAFYAHLLEGEKQDIFSLPPEIQGVLCKSAPLLSLTLSEQDQLCLAPADHQFLSSGEASQIALLPEDHTDDPEIFPVGAVDQDSQQIDLRKTNSWRLNLDEVSTVEMLEVQLINVTSPFILNAKLKPLMTRHRTNDKHIIHVSAMEGKFYSAYKSSRHPHTNMAKAALNMMTRTCAEECVANGIYMNSVDTGWVSEENPAAIAMHKIAKYDFHPPLDIIDGAARILDPIYQGILTGEQKQVGLFLKDYKPTTW